MLKVQIAQGKGGRFRWFARTDRRIVYSSFPNSFASEQQAWEDAEWACGASVTMRYENPHNPDGLFEQHAQDRDFTN